jgi:small-conductance mechanosensitive channel
MLLGLFVIHAGTEQSGSDNGGAAMALFFLILFPLLVLAITALLYCFLADSFARTVAALVLILLLVGMSYLFLRGGLSVAG